MQNKKLIILIILGIAAVFSLIYGIVTPSKARRGISVKPSSIRKKPASPQIDTTTASARPSRNDFSDWGRDPFSSGSAVSSIATASDMVLTGILWDDAAPLAMINDNPVGVGDKIAGHTVVAIKKDRVILNDGAKDLELLIPY